MTNTTSGELVIAVLTYKRVTDIIDLLPMLVIQTNSLDTPARVVVVDNDPNGSAGEPVRALGLPDVTYAHETSAGIANARNAALDLARGASLLVFIDDDERPTDGWLSALVETHRTTQAVVVAGAVVPAIGLVDDPWILAGGFFVRQRFPTGTKLKGASTANLLLDLRQHDVLGSPRFDVSFGMTGGSDTMFTRELVKRGGTIVWCDDAVVVDHVRAARVTRAWVEQRAFRIGNSWSRTSIALVERRRSRFVLRFVLTAKGFARVAVGGLRELFGRLSRSLRHQALGRKLLARGAGMALGAWGMSYNEYGINRASRSE